jgi:hypothetical protein
MAALKTIFFPDMGFLRIFNCLLTTQLLFCARVRLSALHLSRSERPRHDKSHPGREQPSHPTGGMRQLLTEIFPLCESAAGMQGIDRQAGM